MTVQGQFRKSGAGQVLSFVYSKVMEKAMEDYYGDLFDDTPSPGLIYPRDSHVEVNRLPELYGQLFHRQRVKLQTKCSQERRIKVCHTATVLP